MTTTINIPLSSITVESYTVDDKSKSQEAGIIAAGALISLCALIIFSVFKNLKHSISDSKYIKEVSQRILPLATMFRKLYNDYVSTVRIKK